MSTIGNAALKCSPIMFNKMEKNLRHKQMPNFWTQYTFSNHLNQKTFKQETIHDPFLLYLQTKKGPLLCMLVSLFLNPIDEKIIRYNAHQTNIQQVSRLSQAVRAFPIYVLYTLTSTYVYPKIINYTSKQGLDPVTAGGVAGLGASVFFTPLANWRQYVVFSPNKSFHSGLSEVPFFKTLEYRAPRIGIQCAFSTGLTIFLSNMLANKQDESKSTEGNTKDKSNVYEDIKTFSIAAFSGASSQIITLPASVFIGTMLAKHFSAKETMLFLRESCKKIGIFPTFFRAGPLIFLKTIPGALVFTFMVERENFNKKTPHQLPLTHSNGTFKKHLGMNDNKTMTTSVSTVNSSHDEFERNFIAFSV